MSTVRGIKSKITLLKKSLEKIANFLSGTNEEKWTQDELQEKLSDLDILFPKVEELYFKLVDTYAEKDEEMSELEVQGYSEFEDNFHETRSHILKSLKKLKESEKKPMEIQKNDATSRCNGHEVDIGIRTPTIDISRFNGKKEDWIKFYENFKNIIHENSKLSTLTKFRYLISFLEGEAANIIDNIDVTAENYEFAFQELVNHYKNNKMLTEVHISNLFSMKKLEFQSAKGLRDLHNHFVKNVNALKKLSINNLENNVFLVYLLTSKLDSTTLKRWEESIAAEKEVPKYHALETFLINQYNYLESYEEKAESTKGRVKEKRSSCTYITSSNTIPGQCPACDKKWHPLFKCKFFLDRDLEGRKEIVKKARVCWQCLSQSHKVNDCRGRQCSSCDGKHNYLLCYKKKSAEKEREQINLGKHSENNTAKLGNQNKVPSQLPSKESAVYFANSVQVEEKVSIYPTCQVTLCSADNTELNGRFLLDSGSELNLISEQFARRFSTNLQKDDINIFGLGNNKCKTSGFINLKLKSKLSNFSSQLKLHVINGTFLKPELITKVSCFSRDNMFIPEDVRSKLADPEFWSSNKNVDGILGYGLFFTVLSEDYLLPGPNKLKNVPNLLKTALGWVVGGEINQNESRSSHKCFVAKMSRELEPQHSEKTEEVIGNDGSITSLKIHTDGRYIVSLPYKKDPNCLGDSLQGAMKRFLCLEKKLQRDSELKKKYSEFITEYLELGHMEEISSDELEAKPHYYLPHHAVLRDSLTTSLRVVFDGSFKTTTGISLNDILSPGPSLQNNVFDLLTSFRYPKYALTADISKMYRQVWIAFEDRQLQRIIWRENSNLPIQHFKLKTITYGTRPAPYLAILTLHHIANQLKLIEPELAEAIKTKFFMDDYLDGADNYEELIHKQKRMEAVLKARKFELRKWCSNSSKLMKILKSDLDELYCINLADYETVKTLGLTWNPKTDELIIKMSERKYSLVTKRNILAELQACWDPIGILCPVFIKGKIYLQELWQAGLGWDEILPDQLKIKWIKFRNQLQDLDQMKIPRRVLSGNSNSIEFHGFSDASEKAYGAAIYVRAVSAGNIIESNLLCAKVHVAPLKSLSLPRLELNAAVCLSELMKQVIACSKFFEAPVKYWTDSTIVLAWINGEPQQWTTYVGNRVARIQEVSSAETWNHVKSADNPADLLSRGISPLEFKKSDLWWHGPSWLVNNYKNWPICNFENFKVPERKKTSYCLITVKSEECFELIDNFSDWTKIVRILSWILRFINNLKGSMEKEKAEYLTVKELEFSRLTIIKMVQKSAFSEEMYQLDRKLKLSRSSKLLSLDPILDPNGLLRVGGRLRNANIPENRKHQIILPYKSRVTYLILQDYHKRYFHPGPQALLSIVRGRYWPINGKSAVKSVVHSCINCRRTVPKPLKPKMADLPNDRVVPNKPFYITGIDYCGPVYIKIGTKRSIKRKAYIALFVCFATKAIHLELVSDLSSSAFVAALKRFFARRGTCAKIYSDNGTNFVGAQKELKCVVENKEIKSECANLGIEWRFIPPGSPHFGGLWESSVKLLKYHLKRSMNHMTMTFEETYTVLTGIEACLNSRPLTPISDNPNDLEPLTPAHFLCSGPISLPPEPVLTNTSLVKRWNRIKLLIQQMWKRWSQEYLSSLQARTKWKMDDKKIPPGTLVAVKDENLRPTEWKMARIVSLHPGKDGIARVATIHLGNGRTTKRPLVKLCPILEDDKDNTLLEEED